MSKNIKAMYVVELENDNKTDSKNFEKLIIKSALNVLLRRGCITYEEYDLFLLKERL